MNNNISKKIAFILVAIFCLNTMAFSIKNIKESIVNNCDLLITEISSDKLQVSWLLPNSKNIDFIYLQKSINKESFKNTAKVYYQGEKGYVFEDAINHSTTVFYRLIVVDKKGNFEITSFVKFPFNNKKKLAINK